VTVPSRHRHRSGDDRRRQQLAAVLIVAEVATLKPMKTLSLRQR
jgi:hypothetical protein